jgi:hypothetical protein
MKEINLWLQASPGHYHRKKLRMIQKKPGECNSDAADSAFPSRPHSKLSSWPWLLITRQPFSLCCSLWGRVITVQREPPVRLPLAAVTLAHLCCYWVYCSTNKGGTGTNSKNSILKCLHMLPTKTIVFIPSPLQVSPQKYVKSQKMLKREGHWKDQNVWGRNYL